MQPHFVDMLGQSPEGTTLLEKIEQLRTRAPEFAELYDQLAAKRATWSLDPDLAAQAEALLERGRSLRDAITNVTGGVDWFAGVWTVIAEQFGAPKAAVAEAAAELGAGGGGQANPDPTLSALPVMAIFGVTAALGAALAFMAQSAREMLRLITESDRIDQLVADGHDTAEAIRLARQSRPASLLEQLQSLAVFALVGGLLWWAVSR